MEANTVKSIKKYRENITAEYLKIIEITTLQVNNEVEIKDIIGGGALALAFLAKENKKG